MPAQPLEIEQLNGIYRICNAMAESRGLLLQGQTLAAQMGLQHLDLGLPLWHIPQEPDGLPIFPRLPRLEENEPWKVEAFRIATDWLQLSEPDAATLVLSSDRFSCEDLAEWERVLITEAADLVEKTSHPRAARSLVYDYDLEPHLAERLVSTARKELTSRYSMDLDEARSVMVGRLEKLYAKSMNVHDTQTSLKVLKTMAVVQGLSRGAVENEVRDFLTVVRQTAVKQETLLETSSRTTQNEE